MSGTSVVHLQVDLARVGSTLTGHVSVVGDQAHAFTGWIGLNAVIDELLTDSLGPAADTTTEQRSI